jgi:hypothetical protein
MMSDSRHRQLGTWALPSNLARLRRVPGQLVAAYPARDVAFFRSVSSVSSDIEK